MPHRLAPPQPAPDSPLSCSENSLCLKGPAADLVRGSGVCLKAARDAKAGGRLRGQGKKRYPRHCPRLKKRGRRKKTEAAFIIFTSNKTLQ